MAADHNLVGANQTPASLACLNWSHTRAATAMCLDDFSAGMSSDLQ